MNTEDFVEIEGSGWVYWPMCPIQGCKNRICLRLKSKYCYPHTPGSGYQRLIKQINALTEKVPEGVQ